LHGWQNINKLMLKNEAFTEFPQLKNGPH